MWYKFIIYFLFCLFRATQEMMAHQDLLVRGYVPSHCNSVSFYAVTRINFHKRQLIIDQQTFVVALGSARASGTNRFPRTKGPSCKSKLIHHTSFCIICLCNSLCTVPYYIFKYLCISQGPAGKDGLPGHPGQRGETVSNWSNHSALCLYYNQSV